MLSIFYPVRGLLKLDPVRIDNNVFRMHYKITFIILIVFSIIVTSKQYIGDPIDCIVDEELVPQYIMDTYCWIQSTFTIRDVKGIVGRDVVKNGVTSSTKSDDMKFHKYYQWVCFALFFQAITFYVPRYLWKSWEGGRMKMLMLNLDNSLTDNETKTIHKNQLLQYFSSNMHLHNAYAFSFFFCEILNLINVLLQMYLTDIFLDSQFKYYGTEVIRFFQFGPERNDPMDSIFPIVTKCTFHLYGTSGTIQNVDGLCVLPINIVNEKIYLFLWFWFIVVTIITFLNIIYRLIIIISSRFRYFLLLSRSSPSCRNHLKIISKKYNVGDWFVLYQLGKNVHALFFAELIKDLAKKLQYKEDV